MSHFGSFEHWLAQYGRAWEGKDTTAFSALFSETAEYHWTPFQPPQRGRKEIADAVRQATATQRDIRFSFTVLTSGDPDRGIPAAAQWRTEMVRTTSGEKVVLDGVLTCQFDEAGLCREFREWWHSSERTENEREDAAPKV